MSVPDPHAACIGKVAYPSPQLAYRALKKMRCKKCRQLKATVKNEPMQHYHCEWCGRNHIGRKDLWRYH